MKEMASIEVKRSFRRRVVVWVSLLIGTAILVTVFFAFLFIKGHMGAQMQVLLENKALSIQGRVEQRIRYLVENTELLTKNDLVINAFIDPGGRDSYLLPLTENFMEGKNVISLSLVDFDGKILFKTQDDVPTYASSPELRSALAMQQESLYLNQFTHNLTLVAPIHYYGTTQGAVVVVFDLQAIAQRIQPADPGAYFQLIHTGSKVIYSFNYHPETLYSSAVIVPGKETPFLSALHLDIKVGLPEDHYFAPVNQALVRIALIGLLAVLSGMVVALVLADTITRPILTLYHRVRRMGEEGAQSCYPIGTDDELDALALAFDERNTQLQETTKAIEQLNQNLEHRVEEEVARRQNSEMLMLDQSRIAAMGEMISAVSHHWRQPLSVVGLEVQSLRDDFEDGLLNAERIEEVIDITMTKVTEMSEMIDNLRGMSDVRERRFVSVHTELLSVYRLLKAEFDQRNIHVLCRCGEHVATAIESKNCELTEMNRIEVVASDFRQVVFNILVNARDAIQVSANSKKGQVTVSYALESAQWILVSIEDNGGGINPEIMRQVFDPFFSTKERGSGQGAITGVGLGLYQVKMAVEERMGGSVWIENGNMGAKVILRLPVMGRL